MVEEIDKKEYAEMKRKAGEFSKWLIENEFTFEQTIDDWNYGLASYFDVEASNGKVTFVFGSNGYVGLEILEKKENEQ